MDDFLLTQPAVAVRARTRTLLLPGLGIALVAVNLRAGVASVGPLTAQLRSVGMSPAGVALLLAIPAVCFGVFGVAGPALLRRWRIETVLAAALGLLAAALAVRAWFGIAVFFAGTILAMAAVAVLNVVLPALIKRDFAGHAGLLTGVYVTVYGIGAGAAAGLTVPFTSVTGSWEAGLAVWAVPAIVACVFWTALPGRDTPPEPVELAPPVRLRGDRVAWLVTAFVAVASIPAYVFLVWLPSMFQEFGLDAARSGLLLTLLSVVGTPASLMVPTWASRARDQRSYVVVTGLLVLTGIVGLLAAPLAAPVVWLVLLGVGMSGSFSLALCLVVLRSRRVLDTGRLSGMAQCTAFLVAALASFVAGELDHALGSWRPALLVITACLVVQLAVGWGAAKSRFVGASQPNEE